MAEKRPFSHAADADDVGSTTGGPEIPASTNTHDDALEYLRESGQGMSAEIPSDVSLDRKLRRKNDYRMIPLLAACYFITFLDKTNLNVCNICATQKLSLNIFSVRSNHGLVEGSPPARKPILTDIVHLLRWCIVRRACLW